MKIISNETEFEQIISGDKPVVLDFYAEWCAPCQALLPVLEAAGETYGDSVVIAKINVEENPALAAKYGVRGIPAVFLLKNGAVADQFTGVLSRAEIDKKIDSLIGANTENASL